MKAVNLIPTDSRKGAADFRALRGPGAMVVGLLGTVLVLVTLYVLASNSVTSRQSQLANVRQQLSQAQAEVARLGGYTKFARLAQARVQTVRDIASSRFDWQRVLSALSKVVPANTTLSSLTATVSPAAGAGGSSSSGGLRGDLSVPAFELQGCTATQDDVARLMSQLRLIHGVTRVTLSSAVRSGSATGSAPSVSSGQGGCRSTASTFDLVVFFQPPGGTAASAGTSTTSASAPAAGTTSTTSTASTTTSSPAPTATPAAGGVG